MLRHPLNRFFALLLSCACFGACAIHPLPSDVTGYKTAKIVHKIRCEARAAAIKAEIYFWTRKQEHPEIVDEDSLNAFLKTLDLRTVRPHELKRLDTLLRTGIVYNFSLEGTETDSLTFNADIIRPLTHGLGTLSPSASNVVKRDNIRTFTVSDNFRTLISLKQKHCDELEQPNPNYEYPIVGRIGVDEMIETFVKLVNGEDLAGQEDLSKSALALNPTGVPAMVDSLTFTTTISGGLTPKISLSPVGTRWQLMDASIAGSVTRVDTHNVIIGLGVAKPTDALPALLNSKTVALFITTSPRDSGTGEGVAAQLVAQEILRELGRPVIPAAD
jgi:hypothetical protein